MPAMPGFGQLYCPLCHDSDTYLQCSLCLDSNGSHAIQALIQTDQKIPHISIVIYFHELSSFSFVNFPFHLT
jgi:hypothetical protein